MTPERRDELITGYLAGELEQSDFQELEKAMVVDPQVAARLAELSLTETALLEMGDRAADAEQRSGGAAAPVAAERNVAVQTGSAAKPSAASAPARPTGGARGGPGGRPPGGRKPPKRDVTEPRSLGLYLAYALLLHVLFFGLAAFKRYTRDLVALNEIPVDLMMGVDKPVQKPEGGGEDKDTEAPPEPEPPRQAKVVQEKVPEEPQPAVQDLEAIAKVDEAIEQVPRRELPKPDQPPPKDAPVMNVAAAAAHAAGRGGSYGLGRGRGGGRGGLGEGFGVQDKDLPVVSGGAVFGSDKKGALKGHLCFIPVGTRRLSDVGRCKPEGILYANQLNVSPRRFTNGFPGVSERFEWFALDFKGKFAVSKEGEYRFRLHADDGAILWINGEKLIDNDGLHAPLSKMGSVHLPEGKHRIRVFYFQGPRTAVALQLFVTPPGEVERLWTPKL